MGKRKKIWKSEEERLAWEAHVDETIANGRAILKKGWAELQKSRGIDPPGPIPPLKDILERTAPRNKPATG